MLITKQFKDKDLQDTYEVYCTIESRIRERVLHAQGALDIAFARGYFGKDLVGVHKYPKNSHAYAAYLAGKHVYESMPEGMVYPYHSEGTKVDGAYGPGIIVRVDHHRPNDGHTFCYTIQFDSGERHPYNHREFRVVP